MADLQDLISKYNTESSKALEILNRDRRIKISSDDFQLALGKKLGYSDHPADCLNIIDHNLNYMEMLTKLSSHVFESKELICQICIPESFIPNDLPKELEEKRLKFKGHILQVYKNDADSWPSKPHAHSIEFGWKIHLGNGKCFDKNKKLVSTFKKIDLLYIRENITKSVQLPRLEI